MDRDITATAADPDVGEMRCSNKAYMKRVEEIRLLRAFIWSEGLRLPAAENASGYMIADFDAYRYARRGKSPTIDDWRRLEQGYYNLNSLITNEARLRFRAYLRQNLPSDVLVVAGVLMACALLAFTGVVHPKVLAGVEQHVLTILLQRPDVAQPDSNSIKLFDAAVWCLSLGALGAIANVSFNALSIQSDIGFDITRRKLVYLRLILGALFGFVISLPLSWHSFTSVASLLEGEGENPASQVPQASDVISLLLPFILGFSTALMLRMLERVSSTVGSSFGIESVHAPNKSAISSKEI